MHNTTGTGRLGITLLAVAVSICLLLASTARAQEYGIPQMATTDPATGVTSTTAVLNGHIDTGGASVTWYYQYGPTTGYGSTTPAQKIAPGHRSVDVPWTLLGLQPLTFYHYRLVVTASGFVGQSFGSDQGFLTAATGFVFLRVPRLKIVHRTVSVPLSCASKRRCTGRFMITTVTSRGTVLCDSSPFKLKPGRHLKFKVRISTACRSLIKHSRRHRIKAKFTLMPSSSQFGIVNKITLTL